MEMTGLFSRRQFITDVQQLAMLGGLAYLLPSYAWSKQLKKAENTAVKTVDLVIARTPFIIDGRNGTAVTVNGTVPGPLLRFREGQEAVIRVTNKLDESTSIHWHGILLPPEMDGVPGVTFAGIKPGETFTYRFTFKQSGTYWYHSHSGGQELEGLYGPLIVDPIESDPISYDREYIVLLSDYSFLAPMTIISKLKKQSAYFNYQKRTVGDFFADVKSLGFKNAFAERNQWGAMRMDPTDIADVTGATYKYLMNGLSPDANWTAVFKKGERIRLRFIDAGAMTIFDIRIPGLKMTVVQADGQNVQPVSVEELRIGPGETYDVFVEPTAAETFSIFAETMDRSGYAVGTLSTKLGNKAKIPERRKRPTRSMDDMGMAMGAGTAAMPGMAGMASVETVASVASVASVTTKNSAHVSSAHADMPGMVINKPTTVKSPEMKDDMVPDSKPVKHGPEDHGSGNSSVPEETKYRLHEPGTGLENSSRKVLVYSDLKAIKPFADQRKPAREVELHLTGNMERYMWSINGKTYSEASDPIPFSFGERLRLTFVNDTMMEHPMHLHGMWMYLENNSGSYIPRKHTVIVKPAERLSVAVTADAIGDWALHCHMLIHMELGMFRVVRVTDNKSAVKS